MQETNLKISPYFDDFDSSKNYQKVLFKPGYSVQTRELNTLQSVLQNQVEKFGQHVFKDGSIVIPGNVNYDLTAKAVLVQPLINGITVESYLETLKGKILTGATSGVKAEVTDTLSAEDSEKDTTTLYVAYNYGGVEESGEQVKEFKNNEILLDSDGNAVAVTTVQNATSYTGSTVNINAGVYFIRGFFVEVLPQKIILEQYNTKPTYKVGLQITERIVTAEEDSTLYDNSLGSTNFASPGADRLEFKLTLVKQNLLITENSNFIELLRFEDGEITQQADAYQSAYAQLEKNLARRTYANHGSFTTQPYTIKLREALNDGTNGGVYFSNEITYDGKTIVDKIPQGATASANIGANEYTDGTVKYILGKDYYAIELSEGKAYVEGFEVLNERKQYALVPKPRKTKSLNNQGSVLQIGSYVKVAKNSSNLPIVHGAVALGDNLSLKDADNATIGVAKAVGLVDGGDKLYVNCISLYEGLTLSGVGGIAVGDFITGASSGATGYVDSVNATPKLVNLKQITGTFVSGESIISSNADLASNITISSVKRGLLENVRTLTKTGFSCTVRLDSVPISGSSFTVTSGTSLTGINTAFSQELSEKSRIKIADQTEREVDTLSSTTITLSGSVTDGTYYSAYKKICKLYVSDSGLTSKISTKPVDSAKDYTHSRQFIETKSAGAAGDFTLQTDVGTVIDKNSIAVVSSDSATGAVSFEVTQTVGNVVTVFNTGLTAGDTTTLYYSVRIPNSTIRKKTKQSYKFLSVDLEKNSTNDNYGTRFVDKDISLKHADVIKVHAIHQAASANANVTDMFDYVVLNDSSQIDEGDILTLGTVRARVISKAASNKVYIKYLSNSKFQSGSNLAISINVVASDPISGIFIKQSAYGKYVDITDDFKFVRNDTDDFYRISKLVRKSSAAEPTSKFVVVYDYFKHENTSNDFYSVESYGDLEYGDIPLSYKYSSMADLVDFRYYTNPSSVGTTTGAIDNPFKETSSALNIYSVTTASNQSVPTPGSALGLDYEFYTGRVDKVYLTPSNEKYGYITGQIRVVQGADSIEPDLADDESAGLLLATIKLPPYLKKVSDARITFEKTRNYTMKDIGKLEDRIINLEEYTSLSLLEANTNNLNILDDEGKNRFKNGFVVDSFTSSNVADLSNPDFSASLDLSKNIVRPYPAVNNTGFYFSTDESTAQLNRTYVTIPYTETPLVSQTYSSRVENLFPYEVFSWVGNMDLFPKKDIWYDTKREIVEGQSINLVDSYTALFDLVVPGGEIWGDWQLGAGGTVVGGGGRTITDIMEGVGYDINTLEFDIESGDTIQNVTDIKYSRSRIVNINTTLLKPNTRFYFYINDTEANDIIYPNLLTNLTSTVGQFVVGEKVDIYPIYNDGLVRAQVVNNLSATVIDPTTLRGDISSSDFDSNGYTTTTTVLAIDQIRSQDDAAGLESDINPTMVGTTFFLVGRNSGATTRSETQQSLYSDEFGNLRAFALIPPTTFETGDLTFSISDIPGNLQVKGITGSYAIAQYYSQGTELNVTANITTLEAPELTATAITQERTRFIPDPPPRPAGHDPIAQSFFIGEEGVFISSIEVFFLTKDDTQPVTIDIRTMENGTPTSFIIPGSIVTVQAKDVKTSTDASVGTKFVFDNPIFLASNNSYSFITRTTNKNYNMWVSRLGETDVTTGLFIDKQPAVGVLYKSSNQSIWTPDQYEDVKFILNRAQFDTNTTYTAVLPNVPVVDQQLIKNPLKFTEGSAIVKVFQPNHGMHDTSNKVKLDGINSDLPNAQLTAAISGNATSIAITDVLGTTNYDPTTDGWGTINNATVSSTNPGYVKIGDEIITYTGISSGQLTGCSRGRLGTQAVSHTSGSVVYAYQVNGILSSQLNATHTISKVINMDEYEITTSFIANKTKQSGGNNVIATRNIQYEVITPNFNIMSPSNTVATISASTVTGTSIGNKNQESFIARSAENIDNKVENVLNEPKLILSKPNQDAFQSGTTGSLKTYVNMSTTSDRVSPVLDLAGSSMITISNRINKEVDGDDNLDLTSELTPTGGKHSAYITKKVVLETSGTSVKVLFDAIRIKDNDIKVFVKTKEDSTTASFDDMNYVEVPAVNYPASKNNKQFRAFEYEVKGLKEFQEFSVKVVMIGNDQSNVPLIKNFRAIALAL